MQEERLRILEMLHKGLITPAEAEELLDALGAEAEEAKGPAPGRPRRLCIRITDMRTGATKTNINVPMGHFGFVANKFIRRMVRDYIPDIRRASRTGQRGSIIDVADDDRGERVEIFVE